MRHLFSILVVLAALSTMVLAWGYWYQLGHASLNLRVDDYALKTGNSAYGTPHNVSLSLHDPSNHLLAVARSVEPLGFILAEHPDASIGNCQHLRTQAEYQNCYEQYSAWSASWAPLVHSADIRVGFCELRGVAVTVNSSNNEWLLWWVPSPHIGGLPRQYFNFSVAIDSGACKPITQKFGLNAQ